MKAALTELQLSVMNAVWGLGEGSVADVVAALAREGKELAPTTVATLLLRLSKQGWLERRENGRQLMYRATVERRDAASGALRRVLRSFFDGDPAALVAHLVAAREVSADDLEEMRQALKKKGKKR